jgi:adenosylhomocysteine nucleosidase
VIATRFSRRVLVSFLLTLGVAPGLVVGQGNVARPVAVLGIPAEVKDIEAQLSSATVERVHGVPFVVGFVGATRVVLGRTGAGKVNAAMVTTLLISHYAPSAVFFTGTAGALDPGLLPGDVVVATGIGHHDFGASLEQQFVRRPTRNPVTGDVNPMFLPADERLLAAVRRAVPTVMPAPVPGTKRAPVIREGLIVTGDAFVANPAQRDELHRSLKAVAVEMEGAAVAQVSAQLDVPAIVIRSITDTADGSTPDAYAANRDTASRNAATLTLASIAYLGQR